MDLHPPLRSSRGVPESLVGALRELARTPRLLVALDFDGTLAPIVDRPGQARALPASREAVLRLSRMPATRVALISGRALDSLERVAEVPDEVLLVGSHGAELRLDRPGDGLRLDEEERRRVEALRAVLDEVAAPLDNVWIEPKPAGFALHTRLANERDSRVAHLVALREATAEDEALTVREGKDLLEFSVRSTTKGEAIEHLRGYTGATAVFFAGDDVTDEDGFAALGPADVGLKAGTGATGAEHRVEGPEQVALVLGTLAELREGDVHEQ
ncbi:MAG: trehalose-phosphatase [Microbacteriaceae bacterium]